MIVIEGSDGAGKTTLVNQLAEEFGLEIGKRGVANRDLLYTVTRSDTYGALSGAVRGDKPAQIWDRLFFSEMVYAPVVHRQCEFNDFERSFVSDVLTALNAPMIVCIPPFEVVQANITKDKQMAGVDENIRAIYDHYQGGFNYRGEMELQWPPQTMLYDYTGTYNSTEPIDDDSFPYVPLSAIYQVINGYIEQRKEREVSAQLPTAS